MKKRVLEEPEKSVKRIYSEVLSSTISSLRNAHDEEQIGVSVPTFRAVQSVLHRTRQEVRPDMPKTRGEIDLEDIWTKTENGDNFLLIDDIEDNAPETRMFGFATTEMLSALCSAQAIFMDGTFKVVPHLFSQLYSLHAFFRGQMMPLAFFLLPDKKVSTYSRILRLLRAEAFARNMEFNPPEFRLDFEPSALKAIREVSPSAEIRGCNFHFGQCLWRKIQELGLQKLYDQPGVKATVRSIGALAFVPLNAIDEAWLEVNIEAPGPEHPACAGLELFKQYFVNTWLDNETVYPRTLWNQYRNFNVRTTNHLEAWHRVLNQEVGKAHANIFELINHLKRQEKKFKDQMLMLRMGRAAAPLQRREDRERNRQLRQFVEEFEANEITLIEYIRQVASNVAF